MFSFVDLGERRERRWLKAIAAGDRQAFEEIFRRFERPLLAYFHRMVDDPSRAEELVSDTLFEVWRRAAAFEGRSKVSTWIFGIAHYKALDALRRRPPAAEELLDDVDPAAADDPEARIASAEARSALRAALGRLPPAQREAVELAFFHDLDYAEIGAICDVPKNTVKTRIFHAKKKLQPLLRRMGVAP